MLENMLSVQEKCCDTKQVSSNDLLPQLKRRLKNQQEVVDNLSAAITALENNPDLAKVLELIARVR